MARTPSELKAEFMRWLDLLNSLEKCSYGMINLVRDLAEKVITMDG